MELKEKKEEGAVVLEITGRLDVTNSEIIQDKFTEIIERGDTQLAVDCSDLEYISSSGLRAFLLLVKKINASKGRCALFGLTPDIKEVFDISGFSGLFTIVPSKEEAMSEIG